jgi:hypothetical protein
MGPHPFRHQLSFTVEWGGTLEARFRVNQLVMQPTRSSGLRSAEKESFRFFLVNVTMPFEGFEALHALRRGHACLTALGPGYDATHATVHERVQAVARAITALGARLTKPARLAA